MTASDAITKAVFRALSDVNETQPLGRSLAPSDATVLMGEDSLLDSLGFVHFLAAVEERVAQEAGIPVRLLEMDSMEDQGQHFQTVGTLIAFLERQRGT